jgi:hypothetical protein
MSINWRDTVELHKWFNSLQTTGYDCGLDLIVHNDTLKALLQDHIELIMLAQKAGLIYG